MLIINNHKKSKNSHTINFDYTRTIFRTFSDLFYLLKIFPVMQSRVLLICLTSEGRE